ncbi:intradiol ring-cleavage dioxygenase [Ensifer adhaerens]|uniref:intradiol ring-cleavage dioxygenase n=1 Tax=Ensifer adhaerens TaxID=106592 RepID=UPI000FDC70FB|nr:intradiol ring-cleavage dioxygenase [Ensifer adhaerens]MDF8357649.1 intradiol ring-cleavage dioxygenase [Ensifer adhaerens]THA60206.1 6-chlorohydroxyquinol-1,2-dioxygenase [Ensifer adhaerens]
MRSMTENELTDVVVERYRATPDARLQEILLSLIRHAHAFVRDVRLTETEWMKGVEFLTATGHMCDDKRQEMILLSDNLGISALVNMVSAGVPEGATETTVLGPFYVPNSPQRAWGESILLRDSDEIPLIVHGRVVDEDGTPLPGAGIEVWQTDSNGMYDIQDSSQPEDNLRGHYTANEEGRFLIRSIRPTSYPIPTDGPVGVLLRATNRHPFRPAHLHAIVTAPGHQPLTTHLFDAEDKYLDSDVVFAVKESLIRKFTKNEDPGAAERFGLSGPFWELDNDFVLSKARS